MKRFEIQPGNEIRGFKIKLYPDAETETKLRQLSEDARYIWNWLISRFEEARAASESFAVREGLVSAKPTEPDYDGMTPEESEQAAENHRAAWREWRKNYSIAIENRDEVRAYNLTDWMKHFDVKHDYQFLSRVASWRPLEENEERVVSPNAHMMQALSKDYFAALKAIKRRGSGRLRKKRRQDRVPLRTCSGACFDLGDFGTRGRNGKQFYNCRVKFNGLRIRGRLPGKVPGGRVLEGASITREADGWWASIKVEVPIRILPPPTPGVVVGIDVGLENIAAFDDGHREPNTRDRYYSLLIANMQQCEKPTGRLQQRQARHVRHVIYSKILPRVVHAEIIGIEELPADIGQRGRRHISMMRTVQNMLVARYGTRVRAVPPEFTSQDCSNCGQRDKIAWSFDSGPICKCSSCGYTAHRDVNAARNIAARAAESRTA